MFLDKKIKSVGVKENECKSDSSDIESNEGGFESRSENDNEGVGFRILPSLCGVGFHGCFEGK